jgi:hypothetical protein
MLVFWTLPFIQYSEMEQSVLGGAIAPILRLGEYVLS